MNAHIYDVMCARVHERHTKSLSLLLQKNVNYGV